MIGKFVVIDTLENFKSKLSSIPSSAIVLIKDVGQIYAHGTYFGAHQTNELLNLEAAGLAPAGGINANGLISNVDSEWVLTVTNGKDPVWKKLPANAFSNNSSSVLEAATTSDLGGIKVGSIYNGLFSTLTGKHYTVNIDSAGLAYVSVPWDFTDLNVKQTATSLLNEEFSLLFSHTADDETHTEGTRKASNLKFNPSTGTLTTTTLKGNLDGSCINKLTGYSKAKSATAITTSDTLNTALGKLEHKADVVYDLVAAANPDTNTIDTLQEVLSVLSGITDTLTIKGILGNYLPLSGGTITGRLYYKGIIHEFQTSDGSSNGLMRAKSNDLQWHKDSTWHTIIHSGNYSNYALPLSGGTISASGNPLALKRTDGFAPGLEFYLKDTRLGSLGLHADGTPYVYTASEGTIYNIWHNGNDGSGSGMDADLLDGQHGGWHRDNVTAFARTTYTSSLTHDANVCITGMMYNYGSRSYWKNTPDMSYGQILTLRSYGDNELMGQLAWDINHGGDDTTRYLWWRGIQNESRIASAKWHQIAFTDSNVESASKLKNARTIWGQYFDGSGNVSGNITGLGSIIGFNSIRNSSDTSQTYGIWVGSQFTGALDNTDIAYNATQHIFYTGNVGIGTQSPTTKLEVNGTVKATTFDGTASKVSVGTGTGNSYRAIVVTNGSNGLYIAGTGTGNPRYNYSTGDIKANSFTTDGGNFNGNATSASSADKIDGYHISVGSSAGTDTSTIYFVT